ncbi:MAG: BspA family leucine-rich repeat surface protein [Bacteroidaceae bacterium]|nr:BspA family leucine-rich repeat surface protein [Bacteroidaceae bacterium]
MNNATKTIKGSRLFCLLVLCLAFMPFLSSVRAQEAIVLYDSDTKTLTFSAVRSMEADKYETLEKYQGKFWRGSDVLNVFDKPKWSAYEDEIETVVISRFFAECKPKSTHCWFFSFENLTTIKGLEYLDTSEVTDMGSMFDYCSSLKEIDVSGFNTSKVTNMIEMFQHCESLQDLNLSGFDTSNVTHMSWMFNGCYKIPYIDVSNFNTSKLEYCPQMFRDCYFLKTLDLTNFSTSNLICCNFMFMGCIELHTIYCNDTWTLPDDMSEHMFNANHKLSGAVSYNVDNTNTCKYANPDTGYFTRKGVEGDVNKDGKVDISDIVKVINIIAKQ